MPEHLRALVVILGIAVTVFAVIRVPITSLPCTPEDFARRRNLWFVLTLSAFLAHDFWLFVLIAGGALIWAQRAEPNRYALYLGLMLALPYMGAQIPGLGLVNELFTLTQMRVLSLFVLLPTYLWLRRQPGVQAFGTLWCDKLLLAMFVLEVVLTLPERTFTSVVRDSVLYKFTDVFLTYYVASRSLRSLQAFRDALGAFVAGAMVLCMVLVFESARDWLLYRSVDDALGASLGSGGIYLRRAGLLRAEGTAGQSIVAGFTCAVALGIFLYVGMLIKSLAWRTVCGAILVLGLIAALARAPWLGACLMLTIFVLLGPSPLAGAFKLVGVVFAVVVVLVVSGASDRVLDFLPWVGTVDANTVEGRERLAVVAFQVVLDNFWFGRFDYGQLPEIESLRDGSGIIDIVNTYLIIALKGGVTSLGLFVAFIAVALGGVIGGLRRLSDRRDERHALGRSLLATLAGVLFIIATVSPIFFVYPIYWSLAGLAVGYGQWIAQGSPSALDSAAPRQAGKRTAARPRWATSPLASVPEADRQPVRAHRRRGVEPS